MAEEISSDQFIENLLKLTATSVEKCKKIIQYRVDKNEFLLVDFEKIYFCYLNERKWYHLFFSILTIIFLFWILCQVVEEFVSPALAKLAEILKMPSSVAEVTLIAFANGAGDVITAIVSGEEDEGLNLSVGQLYGSGLFIMTLVFGMAIVVQSKDVVLRRRNVIWDLGFLIGVNLFILYTGFVTKEISIYTSITLIGLYVVYVIIVAIMSAKRFQPWMSIKPENIPKLQQSLIRQATMEGESKKMKEKLSELYQRFSQKKIIQFHLKLQEYKYYYEKKKVNQEKEDSQFGIFLKTIESPVMFLVKLTVPPADEVSYDHEEAVKWPLFGYAFLMLNIFGLPCIQWLYFLPLFLGFQLLFQFKRPSVNTATPPYFIIMIIFALLNGLLWNKLLCEILVNAISFVGIIFDVSQSFLGMVVLSIGNALPDGLATLSIAKGGNSGGAISAGIACHLFSLLIALGSSTFIKIRELQNHQQKSDIKLPFDLFPKEFNDDIILILTIICCVLFTQVSILIYGFLSKFTIKKPFAYFLFTVYISFLLFCVYRVFIE